MSKKTRKHIWSGAVVMSLAIVGVLAAFIVLSSNPGVTGAHGGNQDPHCAGMTPAEMIGHDVAAELAGQTNADGSAHTCTNPGTPPVIQPTPEAADDAFSTGSTSASASIEVKVTIASLPMDAEAGSSIEVYLEDDFQVPGSIDRDSVYFRVTNPRTDDTNDGGRVYSADPIDVDDGDHFGGDDDHSIRVFIPDMNTSDDADGYQGPAMGQTITLVFTKEAGIKNPSEAGGHSAAYRVLDPDGDANGDGTSDVNSDSDGRGRVDLPGSTTVAKVSLSDEDNSRGYEMTVTGSGFNNGVTAGAYVLTAHYANFYAAMLWNELDCDGMKARFDSEDNKYCFVFTLDSGAKTYTPNHSDSHAAFNALSDDDEDALVDKVIKSFRPEAVVMNGTEAGGAIVGSDDKVAIVFEVTAPTFKPGNVNYIAVADGEGLISSDADLFDLEPSIRVSPTQVNSGDTVTVFAQDFQTGTFATLKLAGQQVYPSATGELPMVRVSSTSIQNDGSATATFEMPGGLKGTVRVDAKWGDANENTKITIAPSTVSATKTDVLPNETITITGNGFSSNACILVGSITLDNVPVTVDDESDDNCGPGNSSGVQTSNAGQFVATIHLAPASPDSSDPTLIAGTHTLDVEDNHGFTGSVSLTIADPAITVMPEVAGPRDYITVVGDNWPVDNPENPLSESVSVTVMDTQNGRRYSTFADSAGRFSVEHQVHRGVAIPSTIQIEVKYGTVVKIATFDVPVATIEVTPAEAQPGDMVTISATNMPVYTDASQVKIGGSVIGNLNAHTDRDGNITVEDVLVPGLDPGTYSVQLKVKNTVAIGEIDVLPEGVSGAAAALPGAVADFGDNLDAIFHFNNSSKEWTFYDPRPEFAELNTLSELNGGQPYWVLVKESQEDVNWNNRLIDFTCAGGDCWNLEIW